MPTHDKCPVCGMDVPDNRFELEHHGLHFGFCSAQCRDNFAANPRLYIGPAEQAGRQLLKRRKFVLEHTLSNEQAERVKQALFELMGIAEVCIDGRRIEVSYDLLQARSAQVEQAIIDAGAGLGSSWAARFKRGWRSYTEENELAQLAAKPGACCSRPPKKG